MSRPRIANLVSLYILMRVLPKLPPLIMAHPASPPGRLDAAMVLGLANTTPVLVDCCRAQVRKPGLDNTTNGDPFIVPSEPSGEKDVVAVALEQDV